jgi:hypothetical protein
MKTPLRGIAFAVGMVLASQAQSASLVGRIVTAVQKFRRVL